jgi:predicted metalloprotease
VLALLASYFFGVDPSTVLNVAGQGNPGVESTAAHAPPADDEMARFVSKILGSTERTWQAQFQQMGRKYEDPKLVLFTGATPTACGTGQTAMGPFYCPGDHKVYIDLAFYQELKDKFHAPGEFAQAYVIAHEVGHHVQNLLGISDKVHRAQQNAGSEAQANALSVRLELQADCFAGVWAAQANEARQILESGDVEQALTAASAIGDDRLQQQGRGRVVPDTFTHGTSEQRVRWFKRGINSGDINQCNTFQAERL